MKKIMLVLATLGICLLEINAYGQGIDEYTKLLLHFNGAGGSKNFVDSSFGNHSVTANGNAQIDTSQYKFGGASGLFDGARDCYLDLADSEDWDFGNADFTLDFWVRFNSLPPKYTYRIICLFTQWLDGNKSWNFYLQESGGYYLTHQYSQDGTNQETVQLPIDITAGVWYHFALVRCQNMGYIFQDGRKIQEFDLTGKTYFNSTTGLTIGGDAYNNILDGWMDEIRISKGIARWASDFIPPTSEYESIPNIPPLANAGIDAQAYVNEEVNLDGSQSYDPDGQIISWIWKSLSDPQKPVVAEGATAIMNAHGYAEELIELTVTDNHGETGTDTMKITNPGIQGPAGPEGPPGITPAEISAMQSQINTLQQQNIDQQRKLEEDRYLLEQLPQLQKKIEELERQ